MKEEITFEDFCKLDLRVGKIKQAEKIQDSEKLLKFIVDFGEEERQIISGVAQYYEAEEMIGRSIVAVLNLKPREIFGYKSEGMILFSNNKKPIILKPEEEVAPGSIIS